MKTVLPIVFLTLAACGWPPVEVCPLPRGDLPAGENHLGYGTYAFEVSGGEAVIHFPLFPDRRPPLRVFPGRRAAVRINAGVHRIALEPASKLVFACA